MHGARVPQDRLGWVREYGGEMGETYGVPVEEIQEGIRHGVRKVNIDTDIRLAMTGAVRKFLNANRSAFDPRDFLKPAREAAKQYCASSATSSSAAPGWAARSSRSPLDAVARKYKSGEFAQVVR